MTSRWKIFCWRERIGSRAVCCLKLSQAYPEFDENCNEFQNVDVESLGIDGRFMVIVGIHPPPTCSQGSSPLP
jgi:hypothetical protein